MKGGKIRKLIGKLSGEIVITVPRPTQPPTPTRGVCNGRVIGPGGSSSKVAEYNNLVIRSDKSSSSDNSLIKMANEYNELGIPDYEFSLIASGYYKNKLQRHSVITGKDDEDRHDAIDLFVTDAKKNNLPIFHIHRDNYAPAGNKGAASVCFQNGRISGYCLLKWFHSDKAAEILTKLGERMLGHDKENYEFWSIVIQLIERTSRKSGVRLQDLANFPYQNIDSVLEQLPKDEYEQYRYRYEKFRENHDIWQIERICALLDIPPLRHGKCTVDDVGDVIEKNAEMFFDLSRFTLAQADILQELLCMEIEAAAKLKKRNVLLVLDDLPLLKPEESLFNRLLTQVDSHVSVVLSCGELFAACNGNIELFNRIVSKEDTDVFIFAQPSANLELWSNYFGRHRYMTVNMNRTQNEANNTISKWLPDFPGKAFENLTTARTYSTNTEWQHKFSPDKLASFKKGYALGRISSENQLYGLWL